MTIFIISYFKLVFGIIDASFNPEVTGTNGPSVIGLGMFMVGTVMLFAPIAAVAGVAVMIYKIVGVIA